MGLGFVLSSGHAKRCRSPPGRGDSANGWRQGRGRSQQFAKACVAGANHPGDSRGLRHGGDHAPGRRLQTLRVALAAPLYGGRGRRAVARQDAQTRQSAGGGPGYRMPDRAHPRRAARHATTGRAVHGPVTVAAIGTVQKIWRAHGLAPHQMRTFKLSRDPQFAAKVHDVVGLYVDPPAHSLVLSVDEKSQIQALDRTQPGLPDEAGPRRDDDPRLYPQRHDHLVRRLQRARRHGDRPVSPVIQRHRHQEFLRFLQPPRARHPGWTARATSSSTITAATRHPKSEVLAGPPSALDVPLHPDLGVLASTLSRGSLQASPPPAQTRRLSLRSSTCRPR